MFTLVGWSQSIDSAVLAAITAIPDPHVRVQGNDVIVPGAQPNSPPLNALVGAFGIGVNITRLQMQSPSLRRILFNEIAPVSIGILPPTVPAWNDMRFAPPILDPEEALDAFIAESGAGATRNSAFAWLADQPIEPVKGDIRTVRVTATTTLTAFQWSNAQLTFDQSLPAGRYQIVGGRMESAGLLAWRCVIVGGLWRPGAIGYATAGLVEPSAFRQGNMGVWGEFNHNTPPTIDYLSGSADTAEAGELDLIKVA